MKIEHTPDWRALPIKYTTVQGVNENHRIIAGCWANVANIIDDENLHGIFKPSPAPCDS